MGTHKSSKDAKSKDSSKQPKEGKERKERKEPKERKEAKEAKKPKEPKEAKEAKEARDRGGRGPEEAREEPAAEERAEKATRGRTNGAPRAAKPKGRPREGAPRGGSREVEAPEARAGAESGGPAERSAKRARGGGAREAEGAGGAGEAEEPVAAAAPAAAAPATAAAGRPAPERRSAPAAPAPDAASVGSSARSRSASAGSSSSSTSTGSRGSRRGRRRALQEAAGAGASGFSRPLAPPPAPPPPGVEVRATAISAPGSATQLAVLPEKVRGLLHNRDSLAQEVLRMKQAMEALPSQSAASREAKEEVSETTLRMPPRLHESLLHPDNESQLLARTGLAAVALNEEGLVILRAHSRKGLAKALSQLRRVAYHCQWGCSKTKVAALLADKPAKPAHSMVVRLAATSSRLHSHEARLTLKVRKLRIGTQASACQLVIEGIPGLSRRHCTITFEPEKGAVYIQDLSTNGTYLNGKRLPRPPYKNPQDARVRLFHGDEMFFRLRSEDTEELGYVVNLFELG